MPSFVENRVKRVQKVVGTVAGGQANVVGCDSLGKRVRGSIEPSIFQVEANAGQQVLQDGACQRVRLDNQNVQAMR